ncbi:MAG: hypothetical protein WBD74_05030 [Candidatus Aquilonibacter sp.]
MKNRRIAALVALAISIGAVASASTAPPTVWIFLLAVVPPAFAAWLELPKGPRWLLIAGAIYAGLAGLRRMLAPGADITLVEQLSTAAILSLVPAIVWSAVLMLTKRRPASSETKSRNT